MSYELRLPSKQSILPVTPEEETEECQVNVDFWISLNSIAWVKQINSTKIK